MKKTGFKPWMIKEAVKHIEKILKEIKYPKILEFGTGTSTIWFSENFDCELLSVDHDEYWYYEIKNFVANKNVELILKPSYVVEEGSDLLIKSYAGVADNYPDEYFDVILIDGRNRVDCFNRSEPKLKNGGYLILDNSDRSEYSEIIKKYSNKEQITFVQLDEDKELNIYKGCKTTIWKK